MNGNNYIKIDDFVKRYLFHAECEAEARLNQILHEIKKYDKSELVDDEIVKLFTQDEVIRLLVEISTDINDYKSEVPGTMKKTEIDSIIRSKIDNIKKDCNKNGK